MKIREIMEDASAGATCSGSIAPVQGVVGEMQRRINNPYYPGKYTNILKPAEKPKKKKNSKI